MRIHTLIPLLITLLSGALLGGCAKHGGDDALTSIRKKDTLVVGVFGDKPPFGYIDQNGRNTGFDVALARELTRSLLGSADKVRFVTLEASNRVAFLQSNKVDLILANFTQTPARSGVVDFAKPYMKAALGVVGPQSSTATDLKSLKGKVLIVVKGTTAESYLVKNNPEIELLRFDQNTEAFQALKDGRGAALMHDNLLIFAWNQANPGFKVIDGQIGNADVIAPAVKKGEAALLAWTNSEIVRLRSEGFFRRIYAEELKAHFGNSVNDPASVLVETDTP